MPNRVLRDWTNSERFDELSTEAEVFFTRLIMKADDFGGFYGNTKLLKSHLFPLKEFKHSRILPWIKECADIGIIIYYEVDDKQYVRIVDFGQRTRIMKSKFPEPPTNDGQLTDGVPTGDGLKPNQTETKPKQNPKPKSDSVGSSSEQPQAPKRKVFKPPTLDEVFVYCQERGKGINAQQWHDHYTSNGWMVGKNKMKDWKAAVRTWERNNINNGGTGQNTGRRAQSTTIARQDYEDY
jgi:hypothetical protein